MNRCSSALLIFLTAVFVIVALPAKSEDYSNIRIVRLSFMEGSVQFRRPGDDLQAAQMNLPIQQGFFLQTGDGYAEVEFEDALAIRFANNSSVEFTELALVDGRRVTRLTLSQGTVLVTARLSHNDELSLAASNLQLKVPHSGRFRVDVSPTESWVTVFNGKIDFESGAGFTSLGGGHTLHENAADLSSLQIVHSPARDAFDKWVLQREQTLINAQSETSGYLQSKYYTTGFADLYDFGLWSDIPGYGLGWQPYGVGSNWMPYANGQWSLMPNTGWNWMSGEPWGWLPYHFGGWINCPGVGWAWVPRGVDSWQPTTATWVQVDGKVGWIPTPPSQPSKSTRGQPPPATSVVILAAQGANGSIKAGGRMPLAPSTTVRLVSAPRPVFAVPEGQSVRNMTRTPASVSGTAYQGASANLPVGSTAKMNSPAQSVPGFNGPASLRAPGLPATQMRSARLNSSPPSLQAPRSMPASARVYPGAPGGFNGGFGGARGSTGVAHAPTLTAPSAAGTSAAPASSGSASSRAVGSAPHR